MLKNILLKIDPQKSNYRAKKSRGQTIKIPARSRFFHGEQLKKQYIEMLKENEKNIKDREVKSLKTIDGMYVQFKSMPGFDLKISSLENETSKIRLLNVKETEEAGEKVVSATVFIPNGKEGQFLKKINDYLQPDLPEGKKPKNKDLIESVEKISSAVIDSFITTKNTILSDTEYAWYEIWLCFDAVIKNNHQIIKEEFLEFIKKYNLESVEEYLFFSERCVCLLRAKKEDLHRLICEVSNVAEIRKTSGISNFFLKMSNEEQKKWNDELKNRIKINKDSNVCISILDGGINTAHPLISEFMVPNGEYAYKPEWNLSEDSIQHGTQMASICIYDSLISCLSSSELYNFDYLIENGKIISKENNNDARLYGFIVSQVVSNLIIKNVKYSRIYCMALTQSGDEGYTGKPSSWSAELDNLSSGSIDNIKKLFILSAGNYDDSEYFTKYPDINKLQPVQSPAQSWNSLTVGGITFYSNDKSVAKIGQLSPFSTTSAIWENKWPIKPEVVFEAGNLMVEGDRALTNPEVSELSAEPDFVNYGLFAPFWGTSLSAAKAANFAARIQAEYIGYWPETIKGLMIHSAFYPETLFKQFMPEKPIKRDYQKLLRICGYGMPKLERAIGCKNNDVNLVIQSEITPYKLENGDVKLNEYALFKVPWPKELLLQNFDKKASIKVTLCYFVESNPGERGWKDKYKYSSFGLRFSLNGNLPKEEFEKKISNYISNDMEDDEIVDISTNVSWTYGVNSRNLGSVHSDIWKCKAGELSESQYIAVYPVSGWWKTKKKEEKYDNKARFSLIVSLYIDDEKIDLYNEILNLVNIENKIEIKNNN